MSNHKSSIGTECSPCSDSEKFGNWWPCIPSDNSLAAKLRVFLATPDFTPKEREQLAVAFAIGTTEAERDVYKRVHARTGVPITKIRRGVHAKLTCEHPNLEALKQHLLDIGGSCFEDDDFLTQKIDEETAKALLNNGQQFSDSNNHIEHVNLDEMAKRIVERGELWRGVALFVDGRWDAHSWCVDDGCVMDATDEIILYYGRKVTLKEFLTKRRANA